MQSIQTKFIPCTNYRPSRVKAWCERGSIIVSWDDGLDMEPNHIAAADALVAKFAKEDKKQYGDVMGPWQRPRVCGGLPGAGYCHTFLPMDRDGKRQELCPAGTLEALAALETLTNRLLDLGTNGLAQELASARAAIQKAKGLAI